MIAELKPEVAFGKEPPVEVVFSSHPLLDQKLKEVARLARGVPECNVRRGKALDFLGFADASAETRVMVVKQILYSARGRGIFAPRVDDDTRTKFRYDPKRLMIAAATIEFWPDVSWKNMPWVLCHYLTSADLREQLNQPKVEYDPKRFDIHSRQKKQDFRTLADGRLLPTGTFSYDRETILDGIPQQFGTQKFDLEDWKRPLAIQDLKDFLNFISDPLQFPPLEFINSTRLQDRSFTLADVDLVLKFYARLSGQDPKQIDYDEHNWRTLERILRQLCAGNLEIDGQFIQSQKTGVHPLSLNRHGERLPS